jgi:hypothetical protein
MKEIIKKIIKGGEISQQDITEYIVKVTDLFERPIKSPQEIQGIMMMIQMGHLNLMQSIKLTCAKLDIPLRILYDRNGQVIKQYIQE